MFKIQIFNHIAAEGLEQFDSKHYEVDTAIQSPDAIVLRSYNLLNVAIPTSVKAVGRAGVGVNNVPVNALTQRGVPVFNAAGANANAVCELAITGMLLAYRNIPHALRFVESLNGDDKTLDEMVEKQKKQFVGYELAGKTLSVIGLGAIGVSIANAAIALGMKVIGYDPAITIHRAWQLSSQVTQAVSLEEALSAGDLITLHVPLMDKTRHLINETRLLALKRNAVLLNFSRHEIVEEDAVITALNNERLAYYVCDFPSQRFLHHPKIILLPHLGASTEEAEKNCSVIVIKNLKEFLENGNIRSATNFPDVYMPRNGATRIGIANANVPNMLGQISTTLAQAKLNIVDMLNKSLGDIAYTLIDVETAVHPNVIKAIQEIQGVLSVRQLTAC